MEEDLANQIRTFLNEDKKESTELYLSKAEESQDLRIVSKFGGSPYQETNSTWPACSECNNKLDFICQSLLPGHLDLKKEIEALSFPDMHYVYKNEKEHKLLIQF